MNYPGIINTRYLASRSTRIRTRHPRWEIDCCLLIYFCFAWDYLALQDNGRYRCVIARHGNMQVHWIKFALHVHHSGWIAISHQRIIRRRPDFLASAPSHEIFAWKSSWNLHESHWKRITGYNHRCVEFRRFSLKNRNDRLAILLFSSMLRLSAFK